MHQAKCGTAMLGMDPSVVNPAIDTSHAAHSSRYSRTWSDWPRTPQQHVRGGVLRNSFAFEKYGRAGMKYGVAARRASALPTHFPFAHRAECAAYSARCDGDAAQDLFCKAALSPFLHVAGRSRSEDSTPANAAAAGADAAASAAATPAAAAATMLLNGGRPHLRAHSSERSIGGEHGRAGEASYGRGPCVLCLAAWTDSCVHVRAIARLCVTLPDAATRRS
eukprot:41363-Chlamydomonas_euryale.AAC.2